MKTNQETDMKTLNWNDATLRAGPLKKPVRVFQPRSYVGEQYTAIPMDMIDWIRPMLRAKGLKWRIFYAGHRPADSYYDKCARQRGFKRTYSSTSRTTRRANARYAKILCENPLTGERNYL